MTIDRATYLERLAVHLRGDGERARAEGLVIDELTPNGLHLCDYKPHDADQGVSRQENNHARH